VGIELDDEVLGRGETAVEGAELGTNSLFCRQEIARHAPINRKGTHLMHVMIPNGMHHGNTGLLIQMPKKLIAAPA
jgi:hypothetical protein